MLTLQGCQTYYQFHGYNSSSQTELHGRFHKYYVNPVTVGIFYIPGTLLAALFVILLLEGIVIAGSGKVKDKMWRYSCSKVWTHGRTEVGSAGILQAHLVS